MKHASAYASLEPTVSIANLAAAITTAASMAIREKEHVCDRIYARQPNLLASVLAQRLLGVSMPTIDVVLNILIVLYLAIEESGQVLVVVSEADQERELKRFTAVAAARWATLTVGSREVRALASFISCARFRSILRGGRPSSAGIARTADPPLGPLEDPILS